VQLREAGAGGFALSAKLCNGVQLNGGKLLVLWDVVDASRL